jgi:REP element-mobilizing transposase RayT
MAIFMKCSKSRIDAMPKPRKTLISLETTSYYHCVSRCVRRAFLCGVDTLTGESFEHRRHWIVDRIKQLANIFAIEICAYSVMSNHYHVILHVDRQSALNWSDQEVIDRWLKLFSLPAIVERHLTHQTTPAEQEIVSDLIAQWRQRLYDISWFMRCLNEPIARQANQEDGCTGRFWEGRYKSQALLDEQALTACMAYVELNPVRAGVAETPEDSECCSITERINQLIGHKDTDQGDGLSHLLPFIGHARQNSLPKGIPLRLQDYLELVDWTGRAIRVDKRGYIDHHLPPILDRLEIDPKHWLYMTQHFESTFKGLVGSCYQLKKSCKKLGYRRTPNLSAASVYFA